MSAKCPDAGRSKSFSAVPKAGSPLKVDLCRDVKLKIRISFDVGECDVEAGEWEISVGFTGFGTLRIFDSEEQQVAEVTQTGTVNLPGGEYTWQAEAGPGAEIDGPSSGSFELESCGEPPEVTTLEADSVFATIATLNGEITDPGTAEEFEVFFEWRIDGASEWNETPKQPMSEVGTFDAEITGLLVETTYEFRAVAEAGSTRVEGAILSLTTTALEQTQVFTEDGNFVVPEGVSVLKRVLVVAGGGGGGGGRAGNNVPSGGGGAGGLLILDDVEVTPEMAIAVVVGAGGTGGIGSTETDALPGADSSFGEQSAAGGGAGQMLSDTLSTDGGSGGGQLGAERDPSEEGQGIAGQGHRGGRGVSGANPEGFNAGGGGGAAEVGGDASDAGDGSSGNGGDGLDRSIYFGSEVGDNGAFSGGGGGGIYREGTPGTGGLGGGGDGGAAATNGQAAQPNTGGGGGGGGTDNTTGGESDGGDGGSGIVIVQWDNP